ncbi:unnamed protein product [Pylaiella littoralis]
MSFSSDFTPTQRMIMFYTACLPARLSLAAFVRRFGGNPVLRSIVVVLSCGTYFFNAHKMRHGAGGSDVWWCRPVHMLSGLSVAISLIASSDTRIPSAVLLADAMIGIGTSIVKKPFR